MKPYTMRCVRSAALLLISFLPLPSLSFAESQDGSPTTSTSWSRLPGGMEVSAVILQETESGDLVLDGAAILKWQDSRFQADRVMVRQGRFVEAEGNVLVVWSGNRISGTRMTYDLEEDRGVIENAIGQVEPEFFFTAERVEKIGEDMVLLDSARLTTCTQPVPYWSFSVSSARIRIDHYARMWNLRLKARKVPVFYLPYMVWPVKKDRSAGLLFPNFGSTRNRGRVISQALFLPLGESADLTVVGEYYTEAGFGGGGEFQFIPNRQGYAVLNGFFIRDEVAGFDRWRASYSQTQKFQNGFRMVADINQVSDFNYFSDFERDLRLVSSPTILARVEFGRNGKWTSVNVREFRREQLVAGGTLVQRTLPELEFRGRNRRLGKTPFYLGYESSFTSIQQRGVTIDADYFRGDAVPTISVPISPVPWLDITPQAAYRLSYYSQRRDPATQQVVDESLVRGVAAAGLEIVGPKIVRIFQGKGEEEKARYKHLLEPRLLYAFREPFDRGDEVIRFDQVDLIAPQNLLSYGFRSRLFARRPRAEPAALPGSGEAIMMPDGETSPDLTPGANRHKLPPPPSPGSGPAEPLEIATLELTQNRSFVDFLSCADLNGDGSAESSSRASDLLLTGRLNPNPSLSFDLRSRYHILYHRIQNVSLSGNVRRRTANLGFSLVNRRGRSCSVSGDQFFPVEGRNSTQLQLNTGFSLLRGKLRFHLDGSYSANPGPGLEKIPNRRMRVEYYTQCCGFLAEYMARDFSASQRREFRFTVDLRGVGKFLDFHHGGDR